MVRWMRARQLIGESREPIPQSQGGRRATITSTSARAPANFFMVP